MARYIYQGVFTDQSGNVVNGGTITPVLADTSTAANIYTADSGGSSVNSVTSDSAGKFYFYVDTADYNADQKFDITLSQTNFTPKTYEDVLIFPQSGDYVYYANASASDQSTDVDDNSLRDLTTEIGTTNQRAIVFKQGTYTFSTTRDFSDYTNISLIIQPGAIFDIQDGVTITLPKTVEVGSQKWVTLNNTGILLFDPGVTVNPQWFGLVVDDDTVGVANMAILQYCVDNFQDTELPHGKIYYDVSAAALRIRRGYRTMFGGKRSVGGVWGSDTSGTTELIPVNSAGNHAIVIAGDVGYGNRQGTVDRVESTYLHDFYLHPENDYNVGDTADNGIFIDASKDNVVTRGEVKSLVTRNVSIKKWGGYGIEVTGTAFGITHYNLTVEDCYKTCYKHTLATLAEGTLYPHQTWIYGGLIYSRHRSGAGTDIDCWAIDGKGIKVFGGYVHGHYGFRMDFLSGIYGGHVEGLVTPAGAGSADGDGIKLHGTSCVISTEYIRNFGNGILIGDTGASNDNACTGYVGDIGLIQTCTTGINIVATANTKDLTGDLTIGQFDNCTTNVTNISAYKWGRDVTKINGYEEGSALYDFTVDGGSIGDITLAYLPDNATIVEAHYEVITAFQSAGSATVAFGVASDDATGLKTAVAFDHADYTAGAYYNFTPDGTATNFTTKTTAVRAIVMTIATADIINAGKVRIWYKYIKSE